MNFHSYIDEFGNEVLINLGYVKTLTTYMIEKKKKDVNPISSTYGKDISDGSRFYIKFELDNGFFKLETFKDEKLRDEVFKKISNSLLNKELSKGQGK